MVLPTKSRDLLTTWLHDKEKALFLDFRITYGNQTWQSGNLEKKDSTHKVTRSFDLAVM